MCFTVGLTREPLFEILVRSETRFLDPKFSRDSRETRETKLVARLASRESRKRKFCSETREKRVSQTKVCRETRKKREKILILNSGVLPEL